jgi:predicted PurR-regulated permease PerM
LFLVPVVLFYLLTDWPELVARSRTLIPPRWVRPIDEVLDETDTLLGQYLRGQLLVMLSLAVWFSIGLLVAGFELWLPIGVLSGLLIFIPYIGFATGFVFALVAGMLQLGPLAGAVWVASIYGVAQVVESTWLTPRLVGERIGLHPVAVIFALLAFGSLFGFVGVLLALPLAAVTAVGLRRLLAAWRASEFYHRG